MEEHIGKRVNTERVEEALDTGASKIATGCPFCRVMISDGVDDVAATRDVAKAEVLDVAQLLLGSLDQSTFVLPEKGTAAKESEERAARVEATTAEKADVVEDLEEATAAPAEAAKSATGAPSESKPVTGLGIAGAAKRPGAKKPAAETVDDKPAAAAPAAAPKGLGIAGGAKRPGAKKAVAATPAADAAPTQAQAPAKAEPEVKGLGIAGGAKRPGARKAGGCRRGTYAGAAAGSREGRARSTREARAPSQGPRHRRRGTASRCQEGTGGGTRNPGA